MYFKVFVFKIVYNYIFFNVFVQEGVFILIFFPQEDQICVSRITYEKMNGYRLRVGHPGNYSVRIRATSLATNGSWTEPAYFFVQDSKLHCIYFFFTVILSMVSNVHVLQRIWNMKVIIGPLICFIVLMFLASAVFIVLKKKYVFDTFK